MALPAHEVTLEDGKIGRIETGTFLHFDIGLLDDRVNVD